MSTETAVILISGIGVLCFIAGMALELIINAKELNSVRAELEQTKADLINSQSRKKVTSVEITELTDSYAPVTSSGNLFEPW